NAYGPMLADVRPRCPALQRVLALEGDWQELLESARTLPPAVLKQRESSLQCDDPINIQYTSGTTGFPKGATLTHHNLLNNGYFVGELLHYTSADRICLPVPFYPCFGCVMGSLGALTHGSALVLPS